MNGISHAESRKNSARRRRVARAWHRGAGRRRARARPVFAAGGLLAGDLRRDSGGMVEVGMDGVAYLVGYQRGAAPLFVLIDATRPGPGFAAGGGAAEAGGSDADWRGGRRRIA